MVSDRSVHCTINALRIMSEVPLVPVHCYPDFGEINLCVMILCCCDSIGSYYRNRIAVINNVMTLVPEECLIVLLCE